MGAATYSEQARALMQKNLVYQSRSIVTNICLLSGPVFFCILLYILQTLTNNLLTAAEDFRCGCQCLSCCKDMVALNGGRVCRPLTSGYCDPDQGFTCEEEDTNSCGVQYSSAIQSVWCPIIRPSTWPPVTKVPRPRYFPAPLGPYSAFPMPYTADVGWSEAVQGVQRPDVADKIAEAMYDPPKLRFSDFALIERVLRNIITDNNTVFNGHLLSQLGFTFSSARRAPFQYYIDDAFINSGSDSDIDTLFILMNNFTCAQRNMSYRVFDARIVSFDPATGQNTSQTRRVTTAMDIVTFLVTYYSYDIPDLPFLLGLRGLNLNALRSNDLFRSIIVGCVDVDMWRLPGDQTVDATLYCGWYDGYPWGPTRCTKNSTSPKRIDGYSASFNFMDTTTTSGLRATLTYNKTLRRGGGDPTSANNRLTGFLNSAVQGWSIERLGREQARSNMLLGLQSMPKPESRLRLDFSSLLGPLFYSWVIQLLLPNMLQLFVYEKEKRLRMMMKMHGLGDAAYWSVAYIWWACLYIVYIIIFLVVGSAIGLQFFRRNSIGIQIILYLLFGQAQIAFTFFLSTLFTSSRTAVVCGYLYVLATGLLGFLLLDPLMSANKWWMWIPELIPAFALYRGLFELGSYAFLGVYRNSQGMTFANLSDEGNGMVVAWIILAVEGAVFMVLAWYAEQVIPTGNGTTRHPLFFLRWGKQKKGVPPTLALSKAGSSDAGTESAGDLHAHIITNAIKKQDSSSSTSSKFCIPRPRSPSSPNRVSPTPIHLTSHSSNTPAPGGGGGEGGGGLLPAVSRGVGEGAEIVAVGSMGKTKSGRSEVFMDVAVAAEEEEDVLAESARVDKIGSVQPGDNIAILARHLQRTFEPFAGSRTARVAVQDLSLIVERGECFGLLGPNGAGKTTAINMLTGLLEPSAGDATVDGKSITMEMQEIYKIMGVCPQHDLLWEQLTGREHLRFYGRLKGLKGPVLESNIDEALKSVNLYAGGVGDKQSGKYSGGMKRRLSVAISFMGAPSVVYLDEPSTGLDPASRRNLWNVVKENKADRAVILTTHSMQEAEILCDRLGIFVEGRLVCIGTPKEITTRYAGFLVFSITVGGTCAKEAKDLIFQLSPNASIQYELGGTLKAELPSSDVTLSHVFRAVNLAKAGGLQIVDWGVTNATLEEVFIRFARRMKSAQLT